jgi:hypothetical protein
MESTSIYWMPIWGVLQSDFELNLVQPYFIKQLPGRKTDVKDAHRIATCLQKGLIKGSFVPDRDLQQMRQYSRRYRFIGWSSTFSRRSNAQTVYGRIGVSGNSTKAWLRKKR